LTKDPKISVHLSADQLTRLFEPMAYQGIAQTLIDRLLASLDDK
jgi:3-carboxy-cis,cis-muconate cycloisomerase